MRMGTSHQALGCGPSHYILSFPPHVPNSGALNGGPTCAGQSASTTCRTKFCNSVHPISAHSMLCLLALPSLPSSKRCLSFSLLFLFPCGYRLRLDCPLVDTCFFSITGTICTFPRRPSWPGATRSTAMGTRLRTRSTRWTCGRWAA
jgi:hypothetical protein